MKGGTIEGVISYNRRALWRKLGAPKPNSPELPNISWTSSSLLNTSVSGVGPMANSGNDVITSEETPNQQAPSTRPIPETAREALNLMKNGTMPSGSPYVKDITSSHLRLVEACQVHAAY